MTAVGLRGLSQGFSTNNARLGFITRVQRVWAYRRILMLLVRRDLKVRYAGAFLGYIWSVLDPLLMSLMFWFIFTQIFPRSVGFDPYILYLISGQMMWFWYQGAFPAAAHALQSESGMVRSTNVPREIWVLRTVIAKGVEYIFSLPVVAIFAIIYHKAPTWDVLFLPVAIVYCAMLLTGWGLILAPLSVLVRYINRFLRVFVRLTFYLSPILYSVNNVPESLHLVFYLNPTVAMFVMARSMFFPQEMRWEPVVTSASVGIIIFIIGVFVFARMERRVLKEL